MNKRILGILLSIFMLIAIAVPVMADNEEIVTQELSINDLEAFLTFAENCRLDSYSQNLTVSLECDLDLGEAEFESIPIFCGTFLGNGHRICGISITNDGSYQGLFRYLTVDALVQDLILEGDIHPAGSSSAVGAVAGSNAGTIRNCAVTGTVSGNDYVGGIAGRNTVTGLIEDCKAEGEVHGDHFVGGIAGENCGVIRTSTNEAQINTTPQQNSVELSDITLETLTSSESAGTATDIGGIAGITSGVIRECDNRGDVGYLLMGYNIGGIAGTQSGYIAECENYGSIQGRKEVGGIVGQMEPTSQIEYSVDTLQILQGQLNAMSGMVNRASSNAQSNAGQINRQIGVLQNQASIAKDAVETLIPDEDDPQLPDQDTILAAQNTLSNSLSSMPKTLRSIASATQATVSGLTRDLNAISGQIGAMGQTLNGASENLGGTITDVSDLDTEEDLTGKVENCGNFGSVLADLNVGGIAGAMAVENDMDITEDWEQVGESSLNFQSELRAVLLNCTNSGTVTGKKQIVGGITGWQSMGLVKNCINSGKLDAADADYVGGISGQSTGFIRMNYAKCEISGDANVGGIAGSAVIVTDCVSQVRFLDAREQIGAVLGWAEENETEEETPIFGNYYFCADKDVGAIDGISYAGFAEPKMLDDFLAMEELPDMFRTVTVRFLFDDGSITQIPVDLGEDLELNQIPEIPHKEGYAGNWDEMDPQDLKELHFDKTFEAVYTAYRSVIESAETRENGLPVLLVEGSFTDAAAVHAEASDICPELNEEDTLLESWKLIMNEQGTAVRFQLPVNTETEQLKLYAADAGGAWKEIQYKISGSYLVFDLDDDISDLALVQTAKDYTREILIACAAGLILITAIILLCRKRKTRKKTPEAQ